MTVQSLQLKANKTKEKNSVLQKSTIEEDRFREEPPAHKMATLFSCSINLDPTMFTFIVFIILNI